MDDLPDTDGTGLRDQLTKMAIALIGVDMPSTLSCVNALFKLFAARPDLRTLRTAHQVMDCAFKIRTRNSCHVDAAVASALLVAAGATADATPNEFLSETIERAIGSRYVLVESRRQYAQLLLGAELCGQSVLMEGRAGTGKTQLVKALAAARGKELECVNNTDSTTVQDYVGSWLVDGKNFRFSDGALLRAMEHGHWILLDEINLAPPSVLNMLFPLLEGRGYITVPGTNTVRIAHPDFRIFATQNPRDTSVGRNALPASLQSRFVQVTFEDFTSSELVGILTRRSSPTSASTAAGEIQGFTEPPCATQQAELLSAI